MKRIKSVNGYTIYQSCTQRDEDNYNCSIGNFNIYISADIRDYGLSYSTPEWDDIDDLSTAIAMCSGSKWAVACALAEEIANSTAQDMDLCLEIERRLDAGKALETVRRELRAVYLDEDDDELDEDLLDEDLLDEDERILHPEHFTEEGPSYPYTVVYDGGHFIDGVGAESLSEAKDIARDILRNWMEECVSVRDWNQMVTECSVWVEANNGSTTGEAVWEPSDEELVEMGWVEHEEPKSHASFYVTLNNDDNTYTTHTVGFSEGMEPRQQKYAFFKTVAETIAFDDCSYDSVEEVVWDGEPCHYVGWQPGMLMEFRSNITGAIVFSARFPQWNH